jgi:transposase
MEHLDDISVRELQDALDEVDGAKPAQRLLAAIAYKNGVTQTELAEWYGVERRTIYSWLKRLDTDEPLDAAVTDARRPGRDRKLSAAQREEFERAVNESPDGVGYDEPVWTPRLVQRHLRATYGVEYSIPSCRRLLKEAGLRYRSESRSDAQTASGGDRGSHPGGWVPE